MIVVGVIIAKPALRKYGVHFPATIAAKNFLIQFNLLICTVIAAMVTSSLFINRCLLHLKFLIFPKMKAIVLLKNDLRNDKK
jgi:hypothetical protein